MYTLGWGELKVRSNAVLEAPPGPGSARICHPEKEKKLVVVANAPGSAGLLKVAVRPFTVSENVVAVPVGNSPLMNVLFANSAVLHKSSTASAAILRPS